MANRATTGRGRLRAAVRRVGGRATHRVAIVLGALCLAGALLAIPLGRAPSASASTCIASPAECELEAGFSSGTLSITLLANITIGDGTQLAVAVGGSVTLDLAGHTLSVSNVASGDAAISVPTGASLTIEDTGTGGQIDVTGGQGGAGIGGGSGVSSGDVTIMSGTVTASGGQGGAGIGGGSGGAGGDVTIEGGTVTATGGPRSAGIGGGAGGGGGTVTVSGGRVTASGGYLSQASGAGIGSGAGAAASPGGLTIGAGARVSTTSTGGDAIGPGEGASGSASLSNAGTLDVPAGATLTLASGTTTANSGTIDNAGSVNGTGTIDNSGVIDGTGTIANNGQGGSGLTIDGNDFVLSFNTAAAARAPSPAPAAPSRQYVFGPSLGATMQSLPTLASTPASTGWYSAATGGTQITASSSLATVLAVPSFSASSAPFAATLYAQYVSPTVTITSPVGPSPTIVSGLPPTTTPAKPAPGPPPSLRIALQMTHPYVGRGVRFEAALGGSLAHASGGTVTFLVGRRVACIAVVNDGAASCGNASLPRAGVLGVSGTYAGPDQLVLRGVGHAEAGAIPVRLRERVTVLPGGRVRFTTTLVFGAVHFGPPRGVVTIWAGHVALCAAKLPPRGSAHHVSCTSRRVRGPITVRFHPGSDYRAARLRVDVRS